MMADLEKRINKIETTQNEQQKQIDELSGEDEYLTTIDFNRLYEANLSEVESVTLGHMCSVTCRKRKIPIKTMTSERYEEVGSYPLEILKECTKRLLHT